VPENTNTPLTPRCDQCPEPAAIHWWSCGVDSPDLLHHHCKACYSAIFPDDTIEKNYAELLAERDQLKARLAFLEADRAAETLTNTRTLYHGTHVMKLYEKMRAACEAVMTKTPSEYMPLVAEALKNEG
jgi:hypothetical protein